MPITNPSQYSNYDSRTNSYRPVGLTSDGSASGGTGTDNRTILQAVLTDAGVTKGTVIIPNGNYRVRFNSSTATVHSGLPGWTSTIQYCLSVPEGVQIIGQRQSKLILTGESAPSGTHQCVLLVNESADDVSILGLTIEGAASTAAAATLVTGILAAHCEDLVIRDVKITGMAGDAIWLQGYNANTAKYVKRAKVQRCRISSCRGIGIRLSYGRDCLLQGNNFTTNLDLSTGGAPCFQIDESSSVIVTETHSVAWGSLVYLKGTAAQQDIILSDNIQKYPTTTDYASMTLQTYGGIYTDSSPAIEGLSVRGNQGDLRGVAAGTGTWLYLRGITAGSIMNNVVNGGGLTLTAFDVRGSNIATVGMVVTTGAATTVNATYGGGSSAKMSLVGSIVPGDVSLGVGVDVTAGNQITGQILATSLAGGAISGNSVRSSSTSKDGIKLLTCSNVVACGNLVTSGANVGNYGILCDTCTRCHIAGNRVNLTGTSTTPIYDSTGTKNSCHDNNIDRSGGAATAPSFADTTGNYDSV